MEKIILNKYKYNTETDLLNESNFSLVYKAIDTNTQSTVVLKIGKNNIHKKFDPSEEFIRIDEISHSNICKYKSLEFVEFDSPVAGKQTLQVIVMEYINGGNLSQYLIANSKLTDNDKLDFIKQILRGLDYLHKNNLIHRDLKPENVLVKKLNERIELKITDFGISKRLDSSSPSQPSSVLALTRYYAAPEQLEADKFGIKGGYNTNLDFWPLGIMIYEIATNKKFYNLKKKDTEGMINKAIVDTDIPSKINELNEPFKGLAQKCLVRHAANRVQTAKELSDYLKNYNPNGKEQKDKENIDEGNENDVTKIHNQKKIEEYDKLKKEAKIAFDKKDKKNAGILFQRLVNEFNDTDAKHKLNEIANWLDIKNKKKKIIRIITISSVAILITVASWFLINKKPIHLVPFKAENGKFGYKDSASNNVVIKAIYDTVYSFEGDSARVDSGNFYSYLFKDIQKTINWITVPQILPEEKFKLIVQCEYEFRDGAFWWSNSCAVFYDDSLIGQFPGDENYSNYWYLKTDSKTHEVVIDDYCSPNRRYSIPPFFNTKKQIYVDNKCACPFVYAFKNSQAIYLGEILKNQNSIEKYKLDSLEIPTSFIVNDTLKLLIKEEKDETSYIDEMYLKCDDKRIYSTTNNTLSSLKKADYKFLNLKRGEFFELKFTIKNMGSNKLYLFGKGYYIPNKSIN